MITMPPELDARDANALHFLRETRRWLRSSPTFHAGDSGYGSVTTAWKQLTDQLFGQRLGHAFRLFAEEAMPDPVVTALRSAFEMTAQELAADTELPDSVLFPRNGSAISVALGTRAWEIRQATT